MYDQIREDILYIMFYTVVTTMAMIASCYLLLRDGNAFARDITPPVRLRRWVAVFLASIALSHAWYMPIMFLTSSEDIKTTDLVGGLLDSLTIFPLGIIVLLSMLQDRSRPLWPVVAMMAPIVAGGIFGVVAHSYAFLPTIYVYFLLMCIGIIIYMVRATRQYGRWLRDNYADLEHKEVWQSFTVMAVILLMFAFYVFIGQGTAFQYAMQVISAVLVCYLLWRVETLGSLTPDPSPLLRGGGGEAIAPLLQRHCIDTKLYLQHDLTASQLAKAIGTNRYYLSQYFSAQGMNYNAYINDLRINHFIGLYREAVVAGHSVTAHQLASESGYRSCNTFSDAFKRKMGQSVTAWMRIMREVK